MKRFVRGLVAAAVMSVGLAVNAALPVTGGLVCWYDAGVGVTTSDAGEILAWDDQSGLEHHGTVGGGSTVLAEDQLNSRPAAQFRSSYLDLAGPLFVKEQYLVLRSPTATWSGGGGFLCRATGRGSSYDMRNGDVTFWPDQAPAAVSKNGTAIPVEALDNSQFVVRSPSDTWTGGGAILGRRLWRSYYLQGGTTKFWQDVWPEAVSKNGTVIP